jgi:transcriptional regulator with XRE-family HTH domain
MVVSVKTNGGSHIMWEHQVGERVCLLRKEHNLTRAEFGALIGVTEHYIGNIERGVHAISGATIARICNKTGVSADYIIFGSQDTMAMITQLHGLTHEQAQVTLDIAMSVIKFLSTEKGNNVLIQEVLRQHHTNDSLQT